MKKIKFEDALWAIVLTVFCIGLWIIAALFSN